MDANTDQMHVLKRNILLQSASWIIQIQQKLSEKKHPSFVSFLFPTQKKHVKTSPTVGVVAMAFSLESKVLKTHRLCIPRIIGKNSQGPPIDRGIVRMRILNHFLGAKVAIIGQPCVCSW